MKTPNFKLEEFDCKCPFPECKRNWIDPDLVQALQRVRYRVNAPLKVNSACRCPRWNERVGGMTKSYHLRGQAVDISTKRMTDYQKRVFLSEALRLFRGVMIYPDFVHLDLRKKDYFRLAKALR